MKWENNGKAEDRTGVRIHKQTKTTGEIMTTEWIE
jgi:hypothetical protein